MHVPALQATRPGMHAQTVRALMLCARLFSLLSTALATTVQDSTRPQDQAWLMKGTTLSGTCGTELCAARLMRLQRSETGRARHAVASGGAHAPRRRRRARPHRAACATGEGRAARYARWAPARRLTRHRVFHSHPHEIDLRISDNVEGYTTYTHMAWSCAFSRMMVVDHQDTAAELQALQCNGVMLPCLGRGRPGPPRARKSSRAGSCACARSSSASAPRTAPHLHKVSNISANEITSKVPILKVQDESCISHQCLPIFIKNCACSGRCAGRLAWSGCAQPKRNSWEEQLLHISNHAWNMQRMTL